MINLPGLHDSEEATSAEVVPSMTSCAWFSKHNYFNLHTSSRTLKEFIHNRVLAINTLPRKRGVQQRQIEKTLPGRVSMGVKGKYMGNCTALCYGKFPAIDLLAKYYNETYVPGHKEFFTCDRFGNVSAP